MHGYARRQQWRVSGVAAPAGPPAGQVGQVGEDHVRMVKRVLVCGGVAEDTPICGFGAWMPKELSWTTTHPAVAVLKVWAAYWNSSDAVCPAQLRRRKIRPSKEG